MKRWRGEDFYFYYHFSADEAKNISDLRKIKREFLNLEQRKPKLFQERKKSQCFYHNSFYFSFENTSFLLLTANHIKPSSFWLDIEQFKADIDKE